MARAVGQKLTESLGRQVAVEPRPGAGGIIGSEFVAKAAPDGYTLIMANAGSHSVNPGLYPKLPYHPLRDFAPITLVSSAPNILIVHPSLPVKSVKELIVHPRVQKQMYRGEADRAAFAAALAGSKAPVCYNGDLFTADACRALAAEYPAVSGLMLGRGLAADPALVRLARGGSGLALAELQAFADALFAEYCTAFRSEKSAINRMKALWNLWFTVFEDADELQKKMHRAAEPWAYRAAVRTAFAQGRLKAGV